MLVLLKNSKNVWKRNKTNYKNTEKQVAYARQFYNDIVQKYNNKIEMFPSNIVAGFFHFELAKFFEIVKEEQREAPQVKF